ncbi:hypothetical protein [Candidatus Protofrankia datiscae]|uniref:hypothetical protein n=1 Tax=Candidatus Protofrankia datiscae TaxID=2716812 RepID=UPI0005BDB084|nr:hypothetical protein [Candidatus Protofrankia datiscae]
MDADTLAAGGHHAHHLLFPRHAGTGGRTSDDRLDGPAPARIHPRGGLQAIPTENAPGLQQ